MLEELSGEEQTALFSALETEKAAETLTEAEPRAQRQIMANLREERADQHPGHPVHPPAGGPADRAAP